MFLSKDSGFGDELQQIITMKDKNFKRKHLHKEDNSENCKPKEISEKNKFNFKTIKKSINLIKINYTQECPEIYSPLFLK